MEVSLTSSRCYRRPLALSLLFVLLSCVFAWHWLHLDPEVMANSTLSHPTNESQRTSRRSLPARDSSKTPTPALQGRSAVDYIKRNGIAERLETAFETKPRDLYWTSNQALPASANAQLANNRRPNLRLSLSANGLEITPAQMKNGGWRFGMKLQAIGYGRNASKLTNCAMNAEGDRAEFHKSFDRYPDAKVVEWYVNKREGLEQGFTLESRPGANPGKQPLHVVLALSGSLKARLVNQGNAVGFFRPDDKQVLRYDHLVAFDASGRRLTSWMEVRESRLSLVVDDLGAVYPITIDPLFSEVMKVTASDGDVDNLFGNAVALSGDTLVVGALFANAEAGAAYVFERDEGGPDNWGEVKKLTASDSAPGETFGASVAINGDTIVVGADGDDLSNGAAYIFQRDTGGANNWGEVKKLTGSGGTPPYLFGTSVGISLDTVVVGAPSDDLLKGSAFIFERNQGGAENWGLAKRILPAGGETGDNFGFAVAINADTVVAGAYNDDATQGSAFVFGRNTGGTGNWGQVKKLSGLDSEPGDNFGSSVDIVADTIVVGATLDDFAKGSVYVFDRNAGGVNNWGEVKRLVASDGASDENFGNSVAVSGDLVVVGAGGHDLGTGAAYVFGRNTGGANNWGQLIKLSASDGNVDDQFGFAVALNDVTIVVGAHVVDDATGAAYVFGPGTDQTLSTVRLNHATIPRGQAGTVSIDLVALGGENNVRFSVRYNPSLVSFVSAATGSGATGATLTTDASLAASGRVGIELAHSAGIGFVAGTREIVLVTFQALAGGTKPITATTFVNSPLGRRLLDVNGSPQTAIWDNGAILITGQCDFQLSPPSANVPGSGGLFTINVISAASCSWAAVSNDPAFITINSGGAGSGNGVVSYTVATNIGPGRVGTIGIGGLLFVVSQAVGGFEADVAPRPNGSQTVVVSDWVQVGRFSISLDTPAVGSEFQRADCAPRATLGDGKITVADWVQAGRYSVALDPMLPAGGPLAPAPFQPELNAAARIPIARRDVDRVVRALEGELQEGEVGTVQLELDTVGSENALAFTLTFDAGKAVFVDAETVGDSQGARLLVNSSQAAIGRLGIAMALPTGRTFAAGRQRFLTVRFLPTTSGVSTIMQIGFDDSVISREIVSVEAVPLPQMFRGSRVSIGEPKPRRVLPVRGGR